MVESVFAPAPRRLNLAIAALAQDDPPGQQVLLIDRTLEAAQERELARATQLAYLGQSLANVAHELRNPLQAIRGYSEVGLTAAADEETNDYFEEINGSVRRMSGLIDDLLGLARPAAANSTPLHLLLRRLTGLHRILHGAPIAFEEKIEFDGCVAAPGDRLEQILGNLLSNAADALGSTGGTVLVACQREGDSVLVRVTDDGPGIPTEILPRLFEPFASSKMEDGGNGLGLAIAHRLAVGMGGSLSGGNRYGGGAEFVLTVPVADAPVPSSAGVVAPAVAVT